MVELTFIFSIFGHKIIVQDAAALGAHQSDASSLELSDATISVALLLCETEESKSKDYQNGFSVKCTPEGMPLLFMKVNDSNQNAKGKALGVKPYRVSSVRAALLIESSKKEAQMGSQ